MIKKSSFKQKKAKPPMFLVNVGALFFNIFRAKTKIIIFFALCTLLISFLNYKNFLTANEIFALILTGIFGSLFLAILLISLGTEKFRMAYLEHKEREYDLLIEKVNIASKSLTDQNQKKHYEEIKSSYQSWCNFYKEQLIIDTQEIHGVSTKKTFKHQQKAFVKKDMPVGTVSPVSDGDTVGVC